MIEAFAERKETKRNWIKGFDLNAGDRLIKSELILSWCKKSDIDLPDSISFNTCFQMIKRLRYE